MCFYLCFKVFCLFQVQNNRVDFRLILGPGKQESVRNSGEFEMTEFEIADSK